MNGALEIALSGMRAAQLGIDISAHNVANANTTGFTRQRLALEAGRGTLSRDALVGGGVAVDHVQRIADRFVDTQIREQVTEQGYYDELAGRLADVEAALNEASGGGLGQSFADFFSALSDVARQPDNRGIRIAALNTGKNLAARITSTRRQIETIQAENRTALIYAVDEVNAKLDVIAHINSQISGAIKLGVNVSDLQDERNRVVEDLSRMLDSRVSIASDEGQTTVSVNGTSLVIGVNALHLDVDSSGVHLEDTGQTLELEFGTIGAMLEMHTSILPGYLDDIDDLAAAVISEFNTAHQANFGLDGSTGLGFFSGTDGRDIAVNAGLLSDPNKLASSVTGAGGDSGGIDALLALRDKITVGGVTFEEFHESLVASIGSEVSSAEAQGASLDVLLDQLYTRRDSVGSVSLDEEMTNLIKFQQAYNASARIVAMMDELMQAAMNIGR